MIITIGREGFGNPRLRVKVQEEKTRSPTSNTWDDSDSRCEST